MPRLPSTKRLSQEIMPRKLRPLVIIERSCSSTKSVLMRVFVMRMVPAVMILATELVVCAALSG